MQKKSTFTKYLIVLFLPLYFSSCVKNYDFENYFDNVSDSLSATTSLALPIAYGEITLSDFLPDDDTSDIGQYLFVDDDNLMYVKFNQVLDTFQVGELLGEIPDQDTTISLKASTDPNAGADEIYVGDFAFPLPYVKLSKISNYKLIPSDPDQSLDSVTLKAGSLVVEVWSDFPYNGSLNLGFPTMRTANGNSIQINANINSTGQRTTQTFDLANANIGLIYKDQPNRLVTEIELDLTSNGQSIQTGQSLNIRVRLTNLELKGLVGNVAQMSYDLPVQNIDVGLTDFLQEGEIYIANPSLKLITKNYFGLPVGLSFKDFNFYTEENGTPIPVTGSAIDNEQIIDAPTINEYGQFKMDTIFIDGNTTNLPELLGKPIHHISLGGTMRTNPEDITRKNFVGADQTFTAEVDLSIPLDLRLRNLEFTDTMDFKLDDALPQELDPQSAELLLNFTNGFPLDASLQLYFMDETKTIIDSAFTNQFQLISANTDTNGKVNEKVQSKNVLSLSKEKFTQIKKASYMILWAKFQTENADQSDKTVKIYSDYTLGLDVGVKATASFSTSSTENNSGQ